MVQEPVEHGGDRGRVAEEPSPVVDGAVRGDEGARPLVASHDQLEQILGGRGRQLPHSEVVEDEQRHAGQLGDVLLAVAVEGRVCELFEQHVDLAVGDTMALVDRGEADRLGDVALAGAGWAEEDSVFGSLDEAPRGEIEDEGTIGLRVELEVEAVEGLLRVAEASLLDAPGTGCIFNAPLRAVSSTSRERIKVEFTLNSQSYSSLSNRSSSPGLRSRSISFTVA